MSENQFCRTTNGEGRFTADPPMSSNVTTSALAWDAPTESASANKQIRWIRITRSKLIMLH